MWCLYEFDDVTIPDLHPVNFQPVGSPRVRDYLTPIMDGEFIDRYQDVDGNYEDVPAGRRTMAVSTLAKKRGPKNAFTLWNDLRVKSGTYGKLFRKWIVGSGQDFGGGEVIPEKIYGDQWVWARMIERPLTKYGTVAYDGTSSIAVENPEGATPKADHTTGNQPMDFIFETVSPYWRSEFTFSKEVTPNSGARATMSFGYASGHGIGELPITDAKITITGCTSVKFAIPSATAWEISGLTNGNTYIVDSLTDQVYEESAPETDLYSLISFGTTIDFTGTYAHTKAPLIYVPNSQTLGYFIAEGSAPSLTMTYYISFKD